MPVNDVRNSFFKQIYKLLSMNKDIIIIAVDLAGPPFDQIRQEFPNNFINVGIAEQSAIELACGFALNGKRTIVYAANPFLILRGIDQIRNCACMMGIPINIVGLGTGFSVSECGSTHFSIDDISVANICPNLDIYNVSDNQMAIKYANNILTNTVPTYYRMGKWAGENLGLLPESLDDGYRMIRKGNDVAILTYGCSVNYINGVEFVNINPTIYDVFKIQFDFQKLILELKEYSAVLVFEEHLEKGGLGSIVQDLFISNKVNIPLYKKGIELINNYPQVYGDREYWLNYFHLSRKDIIETLETLIKMKV